MTNGFTTTVGAWMLATTLAVLALVFASSFTAEASTYEVGPGKALAAIADVPWESLQSGDSVRIHWRAQPYNEKFVIGVAGTPEAPITISGVPGPDGQLPVLDGRNAVTRRGLAFNNEDRSVVQLGGLRGTDVIPANIVIENLEIRSGRAPYTFTNSRGEQQTYQKIASSIRFNICDGVVVRGCVIRDSGNGTLSSGGTTRNITIEGCLYTENGLDKSDSHSVGVHQTYTETVGMLYQYNHFTPLREGCLGSNLKDRSGDNVIRYNWIEGGTKQIDLPDWYDTQHRRAEAVARGDKVDYDQWIRDDSNYRATFVYGNVLIEPDGDGLPEILTYGGDMSELQYYHNGILYFYNNTVITHRSDEAIIFRLRSINETCDARNNIFYATNPNVTIAMMYADGALYLSHNWISDGWRHARNPRTFNGEVNDDGTNITGAHPGFVDAAAGNFRLAEGSPCIDAGRPIAPRASVANMVTGQYVKHRAGQPRPDDGKIDIGAYEYAGDK